MGESAVPGHEPCGLPPGENPLLEAFGSRARRGRPCSLAEQAKPGAPPGNRFTEVLALLALRAGVTKLPRLVTLMDPGLSDRLLSKKRRAAGKEPKARRQARKRADCYAAAQRCELQALALQANQERKPLPLRFPVATEASHHLAVEAQTAQLSLIATMYEASGNRVSYFT